MDLPARFQFDALFRQPERDPSSFRRSSPAKASRDTRSSICAWPGTAGGRWSCPLVGQNLLHDHHRRVRSAGIARRGRARRLRKDRVGFLIRTARQRQEPLPVPVAVETGQPYAHRPAGRCSSGFARDVEVAHVAIRRTAPLSSRGPACAGRVARVPGEGRLPFQLRQVHRVAVRRRSRDRSPSVSRAAIRLATCWRRHSATKPWAAGPLASSRHPHAGAGLSRGVHAGGRRGHALPSRRSRLTDVDGRRIARLHRPGWHRQLHPRGRQRPLPDQPSSGRKRRAAHQLASVATGAQPDR